MNNKINVVVKHAEELGVDAKDLISALLERDKTDIMDLIGREIENGRNQGLSADHVFSKLSDLFGEEQIATYLEVQSLVDMMMSHDGLKISIDFYSDELESLKSNRELIRYELNRRGVSAVGYVGNSMSGVFTIQADRNVMDMLAWNDMYCAKLSEIESYISDSLERFLCDILGEDYDCVDVGKEVDQALSYKDIWNVLHNEDISGFSKHEWDIYFAAQAVIGNTIYCDDDIAAEIVRLYEYRYQHYEDILNVLSDASNLSVYRDGYIGYLRHLGEYDSFDELISRMGEAAMENWYCYNCDEIFGTEEI